MREYGIKQMKWFVYTLLKIRANTELTPSYVAPIIFNPATLVEKFPELGGEATFGHIECMLDQIQNDEAFFEENGLRYRRHIVSTQKADGCIEIKGCATDLLEAYQRIRLDGGKSIFGQAIGVGGKQVIKVWEEKTNVPISGNQQAAFSYLLKNFNKEVSHVELFNEIGKGRFATREFKESGISDSEKKGPVNDTIHNLRNKLDEAGGTQGVKSSILRVRTGIYKMDV